jgi:hypothetical protein
MCGRGPVRLMIGAVLATLAWLSSCTYSPSPKSGLLFCGPGGACPKGYGCADGRTCWKEGETPPLPDGGGLETAVDLVTRADAPVAPRLRPFVGSWDFESGTVSTTCSDNSRDTRLLAGDFLDIDVGTDSDLVASFYCDWKLNLVAGSTVPSRPAQTCTTISKDTEFTWTLVSFEFTTGDGQNATLLSRINAAYKNTGVGTCMLTIAGEAGGVSRAVLIKAP